MGDAGDLVRPDILLLERVVRVAVRQEMLEEAHVLKTEQGDLVMRLPMVLTSDPRYRTCNVRQLTWCVI